jgi:hypothetical protein
MCDGSEAHAVKTVLDELVVRIELLLGRRSWPLLTWSESLQASKLRAVLPILLGVDDILVNETRYRPLPFAIASALSLYVGATERVAFDDVLSHCPFHPEGRLGNVGTEVAVAAQHIAAHPSHRVRIRYPLKHYKCAVMLGTLLLVYCDLKRPVPPKPRFVVTSSFASVPSIGDALLVDVMRQLGDADRQRATCVSRQWSNAASDFSLDTAERRLGNALKATMNHYVGFSPTPRMLAVGLALTRLWMGEL